MTTLFKIIDYFMLFIHPSSNHRLWSLLYKLHFYHCFELEEGRNHSRKHRPDIKLVEQWEAWRFVCWWVGCWVRGGGFSEGVLPGRYCGITGHVQELCLWTHKCLFASTVCGWGNRHPSDSAHGGSCHSNSVFLFYSELSCPSLLHPSLLFCGSF